MSRSIFGLINLVMSCSAQTVGRHNQCAGEIRVKLLKFHTFSQWLNPFTPNKTPAMPDLVQANSSHSNPTSPWSYAHHRDDLSARQRECEDAPRRAAKELRWQAWSTAWKDLEDGQRRISCVSSMHLYMSPKNRDEETLSRWVSMICLTTCWRNACVKEPTVERF